MKAKRRGDAIMFTRARTIPVAATVLGLLGGAIPALASEHNGQDKHYGGPVQTWCDINPDFNGWKKRIHPASLYGSAPQQKHRPSPQPGPQARQPQSGF